MNRCTLFFCLLLLAACAPAPTPLAPGAIAYPEPDWLVADPEAQGLDPAVLLDMDAALDESGLDLHSLLILRNGQIVYERYWSGYTKDTRHTLYSVTKSFTATLAGIAIDQGKIHGVDVSIQDLLPVRVLDNSDSRKDAITLEDLLTMRSGLDWYENDSSYRAMYVSGDMLGWTMDLPQIVEPGETFLYCSACSHVISAAVQEAVGMDGLQYVRQMLFEPLGIKKFDWEKSPEGYLIGGWGLELTPRDMARLGYLYLNEGKWQGKQIVSASWIAAATTSHTPTDGDLGYGYQWWIYPRYGAYTALGRDGQTIFVIPSLEMVIVTTAQIGSHDPIFDLIDNYIVPSAEG